eukprot:CAMPEP_0198154294 /NCGR_PEP_ID=MMETSP1443-20131203/68073_1 /TAXON_ID=186043 /ORGANISM="Entomoneis sp., Strain CCMP2396" /LENGTH=65 /DNA_ID=CAMNT_0043820943 /DNA_START=218 /DNA_END=411 /DNA_ORIENTATION=-
MGNQQSANVALKSTSTTRTAGTTRNEYDAWEKTKSDSPDAAGSSSSGGMARSRSVRGRMERVTPT